MQLLLSVSTHSVPFTHKYGSSSNNNIPKETTTVSRNGRWGGGGEGEGEGAGGIAGRHWRRIMQLLLSD